MSDADAVMHVNMRRYIMISHQLRKKGMVMEAPHFQVL
jgi:hypothetical protein